MKNDLKKLVGEKIIEFVKKEEPNLTEKDIKACLRTARKFLEKK